tara:strand:+ start:1301 stop:1597 length:297 start_codon:yes stop_codon:yes gene_type:complete
MSNNYINAQTRRMFKDMLNQVGKDLVFGDHRVKYGDALRIVNGKSFESLFNIWVTKCQDKGLMEIDNTNSSEKYLKWSDKYSSVEKAVKGMEILKGII